MNTNLDPTLAQLTFEQMNQDILFFDDQGKITYSNTRANELFDMSSEKIIGKDIEELVSLKNSTNEEKKILYLLKDTDRWEGILTVRNLAAKAATNNTEEKVDAFLCAQLNRIRTEHGGHVYLLISKRLSEIKNKLLMNHCEMLDGVINNSISLKAKYPKSQNTKNLTKKEKIVLAGMGARPDLNDIELAELLGEKRSTITAIRNRLKEKKVYMQGYLLDFPKLGINNLCIFYAYLKKDIDIKKAIEQFALDSFTAVTLAFASENIIFVMAASADSHRIEEISEHLRRVGKENDLFSRNLMNSHISLSEFTIYRMMDYAGISVSLFKDELPEKIYNILKETVNKLPKFGEAGSIIEPIALGKNEKRVLYALIKYPQFTNIEVARRLNLSLPTVGKLKKGLLEKGIIKPFLRPNLLGTGIKMGYFCHKRFQDDIRENKAFLEYLKNENSVVSTYNKNRFMSLSFYRNLEEFNKARNAELNLRNKLPFIEDFCCNYMLNYYKFHKFDFASLLKEHLAIKEDF